MGVSGRRLNPRIEISEDLPREATFSVKRMITL
jgi:hypothetical protein